MQERNAIVRGGVVPEVFRTSNFDCPPPIPAAAESAIERSLSIQVVGIYHKD